MSTISPFEVKAQNSEETTQPSTPFAATAKDGDRRESRFAEDEEEESMTSSLEEIEDLLHDSPPKAAAESPLPTSLLVSLGRAR